MVLAELILVAVAFCLMETVNFTFTDFADYLPIGLIAATAILLVRRDLRRPLTEPWVKAAARALDLFAVLPPLLVLGGLYLQSHVAAAAIGHWPREMADDPKYIAGDSAAYQRVSSDVIYLMAFAGWAILTWVGLLIHLRGSIRPWRVVAHVLIFLAAWAILVAEPGGRFLWWLD